MKTIESKDNSIYKGAVKLTRKKYRDETDLYLIEGKKPVTDALNLGIRIHRIFLCSDVKEKTSFPENLSYVVPPKLFAGFSSTESTQGVVAVAEKKQYPLSFFLDHVMEADGNVVVLDRLQDPGNVGTIIRTAEAAGYGGIILLKGSADVYAPKIVRAAAGSLFRMPIVYGEQEEVVSLLKKAGKKLTASCLDTKLLYDQADLTRNIALIIGNEGRGISQELLDSADIKLKIPMKGSIESLNAAVAAGILMYQSRREIK